MKENTKMEENTKTPATPDKMDELYGLEALEELKKALIADLEDEGELPIGNKDDSLISDNSDKAEDDDFDLDDFDLDDFGLGDDGDDDEEEKEDDDDESSDDETFEEAISFLDEMVGMEPVKENLLRLARYVQWKNKLEAVSIDTSNFPEPNLTFMFLGDSGTGKTTVAYRMGRILHSLGLIPSRKTMEFRREDLIGENYGSEEKATREALKRSMGSVFFLDETYQCFKQATDRRDPGYHILETLMAQFGRPGRCIIMAGYKEEMMEIFKVNQGFRSRIPDENIIEFKGATEDTLMRIAINAFNKMEFHITTGARKLIRQTVHDMFLHKDRNFGNARTMTQLAQATVINHANRIMLTTQCDDFKITKADIQQSLSKLIKDTPTRTRIGF